MLIIFFKCHFLWAQENLRFHFASEEGNFLSNALSLLKKSLREKQGSKPKRWTRGNPQGIIIKTNKQANQPTDPTNKDCLARFLIGTASAVHVCLSYWRCQYSFCSSSSPLTSNFVNVIFINASSWMCLVLVKREIRRNAIIPPTLGLVVYFHARFLLAGHAACLSDCFCSGSAGVSSLGGRQVLARLICLVRTLTNMPYIDLIVLCPDRADSLQTSQDAPSFTFWLSLHRFPNHVYLFHC